VAVLTGLFLAGCAGGETPGHAPRPATVDAVPASTASPLPDGPYVWRLPRGFPTPMVPADNPMSHAKVDLGRRLFYDVRLSANQTQSCASCHEQARAFTDGKAHGVGSTGQVHPRGAQSLANVAYAPTLTWGNPLITSLEQQAMLPLFGDDPVELGMADQADELVRRLTADSAYVAGFAASFPAEASPVTIKNVTRALATFQRTLISGDAPYDRFERGDRAAVSDAAKRGASLFFGERFECFHCHGGFAYSDAVVFEGAQQTRPPMHNTGLYNLDATGAYPSGGRGAYEATQRPGDMGAFKAPSLRNVAVTAPYMHDGSIATLGEAIDHYAAGGRTIAEGPHQGVGARNPNKDALIQGFRVTPEEKADLIAFLESLTDTAFLTDPAFADPAR
jgi:cytochrome c peroxidase